MVHNVLVTSLNLITNQAVKCGVVSFTVLTLLERELLIIIPSSPCVRVVTMKFCMLVDR